ncbi:superoxide dismutase family protein [Novosphingobium sp. JCM 18896]|uniref:superoxide dismutase family protein n=1 Tax=Novosphingobium sp. JCM 18896 TaxID=2989731 RepID=UPI00222229C2|nr:superoxide dismutase family protein [Novosphingobium sp. JCM 18896]MCW1429143.1 superoxide dismutase family protein [Novosphingobium sp. JCM 18896]
MKTKTLSLLLVTGALASSAYMAAAVAKPTRAARPAGLASATLRAADGTPRGKAWIANRNGHWDLKVEAIGVAPGAHGVHLHTVGKCDAPDFTSAGGHLNPHGKMHGTANPQGPHLGDLPNLIAGTDGKGTLTAGLTGSAAELNAALFDADGTAVVIHAGPDDNRTDPSGNSGGRVACGVLTRG